MAAIDTAASPVPFGASHWQRYCTQETGAHALVFGNPEETRGFVLFSIIVDEGSIDNIAVLPAAQGRGVGGILLREALAVMRKAGAGRCLLDVRESNLPARALYTRDGFTEDGRRPGYYSAESGREDAILMSRRL